MFIIETFEEKNSLETSTFAFKCGFEYLAHQLEQETNAFDSHEVSIEFSENMSTKAGE